MWPPQCRESYIPTRNLTRDICSSLPALFSFTAATASSLSQRRKKSVDTSLFPNDGFLWAFTPPDFTYILIASYSPHRWGRDSCPRLIRMAEHVTPGTWQQCISHIFSQPGAGGHHTPHRATGGVLSRAQWISRAAGGKLCSNKRVRCPLVPMGGCDWLVWMISQAGKELKPTRQG